MTREESTGGELVRDLNLQSLEQAAVVGGASSTETILRAFVDDVYWLALRMLWHPQDAEAATQKILLAAVAELRTFRRETALRMWIFRLAASHLLAAPPSPWERQGWSFDAMAED